MAWRHLLGGLQHIRGRRLWYVAVNVLLGLALLAVAARPLIVGWQQLPKAGVRLSLPNLGAAVALYGLNFSINMLAWQRIIARFGGPSAWAANALAYSYTNIARFLPTPVWFLASRVYFYGRMGMQWRPVLITTGLETLLHALAGVALYTLLAIDSSRPATWLATLACAPAAIAVLRPHWLEVGPSHGAREKPGLRRRDVAGCLVLYLVTWLIAGVFFSRIICTFSDAALPHFGDLLRIWIAANLVAYVGAYTLGGIGILREFSLTWCLGRVYPAPVALLIAVGNRLVLTGAAMLCALGAATIVSALRRVGMATHHQPLGD